MMYARRSQTVAPARRVPSRAGGCAIAALRPRAGGPAERFASWLGVWHPAAVFLAALLAGFAALILPSLLLGHLITDVVLTVGWIQRADEGAIDSLVAARTPFLTDASGVASAIGGVKVLAPLAGLVAAVCAALRSWSIAAFAVVMLILETAAYRVTLWMVPRQRPGVARLDNLPVGGSYPSGHTAASIVVYAGLALLLTSAIPSRALRIPVWGLAVVLATFVAMSRLYRGMHHPLDIAGGVFVGVGAVVVLVFACRAAEAARARCGRHRNLTPASLEPEHRSDGSN